MRPFDSVKLLVDLPDKGISAGTEGTIVEAYPTHNAYLVEFFDGEGDTIDVVDVLAHQIVVILPDFFPGEQIAILQDVADPPVKRGQVGRIKDRTGVGQYQIEFSDSEGHSIATATLPATQLLLLHWEFATS